MNEMITLENNKEFCLICGASIKGLRFQVNCCRACSAFYRRSVKAKISYKCQRGNGLCDVSINRPICRFCRLKRCIEIGMKLEKDGPIGNQKLIEEGAEKPTSSTSTTTTAFNEKLENIEVILQEISSIFQMKGSLPLSLVETNLTKDFSIILSEFLNIIKPQPPLTKIARNGEISKRHIFLGNYLVNIAKMLSKFPYFVVLDSNEKYALYKRFWQIFHILERCYQAVEHFGDDPNDFRFIVGNEHYVDLTNFNEFFDATNKSQEARKFWVPFLSGAPCVMKLFKKLRITVVELAYVSLLALWFCFELDEISETTQKLADEIVTKASDGLHQYYVRDLHNSNYALRQADLFKLVKIIEWAARERRNIVTANNIFNFSEKAFNFSAFI